MAWHLCNFLQNQSPNKSQSSVRMIDTFGKIKIPNLLFSPPFLPFKQGNANFSLSFLLSFYLQNPKNVIFRSFQNPNKTHQIPQNPAPKPQKWRLSILLCPNSIAPKPPLNPFKWRLPPSNRPPSDLRSPRSRRPIRPTPALPTGPASTAGPGASAAPPAGILRRTLTTTTSPKEGSSIRSEGRGFPKSALMISRRSYFSPEKMPKRVRRLRGGGRAAGCPPLDRAVRQRRWGPQMRAREEEGRFRGVMGMAIWIIIRVRRLFRMVVRGEDALSRCHGINAAIRR